MQVCKSELHLKKTFLERVFQEHEGYRVKYCLYSVRSFQTLTVQSIAEVQPRGELKCSPREEPKDNGNMLGTGDFRGRGTIA